MRNKLLRAIVLSLFVVGLVASDSAPIIDTVLKIVREGKDGRVVPDIVGGGDLSHGYFKYHTFWQIKEALQHDYPDFLSKDIEFGRSHLDAPINGFFIGRNANDLQATRKKNLIFVDSSHHAREATSFMMVMALLVKELIRLQHGKSEADVYDHVSLLVLPVVNVDGVMMINKDFSAFNDRRKNLRKVGCKDKDHEITDGVDLNRNYDIEFESVPEYTLKKCGDEFRGEKPFSEPETRAVLNATEAFPNIVTALNLHAWGNLWIHPYNFLVPEQTKSMNDTQPDLFKLYQHFKANAKMPPGVKVGQAKDVIFYSASGEASDWMAVKKNIFAWSPELGSQNSQTDDFYLEPPLQREVISVQYPTIRELIDRHKPKIAVVSIRDAEHLEKGVLLTLDVENESYSKLREVQVKFNSAENELYKLEAAWIEPGALKPDIRNGSIDRLAPASLKLHFSQIAPNLKLRSLGLEFEIDGRPVASEFREELVAKLPERKLRITGIDRSEEARYYVAISALMILFCYLMLCPNIVKQRCLKKKDRGLEHDTHFRVAFDSELEQANYRESAADN